MPQLGMWPLAPLNLPISTQNPTGLQQGSNQPQSPSPVPHFSPSYISHSTYPSLPLNIAQNNNQMHASPATVPVNAQNSWSSVASSQPIKQVTIAEQDKQPWR